jgi:ParB/RepB/Spo0J family partition protein
MQQARYNLNQVAHSNLLIAKGFPMQETLLKAVDAPVLMPVDRLLDHPDNPRIVINDTVFEQLTQSMKTYGFRKEFAIIARPVGDDWQIVSGHRRKAAAIAAGITDVHVWQTVMDDQEAFLMLREANFQGELSAFEEGRHAENATQKYNFSLQTYCDRIGISRSTLLDKVFAWRVLSSVEFLAAEHPNIYSLPFNQFCSVFAAPERLWKTIAELFIVRRWSIRQIDAAVTACKSLKIPELFQDWLPPNKWEKEVIIEAGETGQTSMTGDRLMQCIALAQEIYDDLSDCRPVWLFKEKGEAPHHETVDLKAKFLAALTKLSNPTENKIRQLQLDQATEISNIDYKFEAWQEQQKTETQRLQEIERQQQEQAIYELEFAPKHFAHDAWSARTKVATRFDAIFADPIAHPEGLLSMDWHFEAMDMLAPSGKLIVIYPTIPDVFNICQLLTPHATNFVWKKPNTARLSEENGVILNAEFIFIFTHNENPSERRAQEEGELTLNPSAFTQCLNTEAKQVLEISLPVEAELLPWAGENQRPLLLAQTLVSAFSNPGDRVLELFASNGATFTTAAKQLGRKGIWLEPDASIQELCQARLNATKLPDRKGMSPKS